MPIRWNRICTKILGTFLTVIIIGGLCICESVGRASDMPAPATSSVLPLSAAAQLGRKIFYDVSLSASGALSCASCHNPDNAYAPGNAVALQTGGAKMDQQGGRAVPSLRYHEYAQPFSIGPDTQPDQDDKIAVQQALAAQATIRNFQPIAKASAPVQDLVPQGGFDWDGRAINLTDQASGPFFAANEMANADALTLVKKLQMASYAADIRLLFGPGVFASPSVVLGEVYFALAQYQKEDRSFHPYDSKYDAYLAKKVSLTAQEMRGLRLFIDPEKGNCATCHIATPSHDGLLPPTFTDYQFEALAAPRNPAIVANQDPQYHDLGMCGPWRHDLAQQTSYCGYFKTPTLRNVATRQAFFHNGIFRSLDEVLHFYVERETQPEKWYPRGKDGKVEKYNDLPAAYHVNVDLSDAPFDRHQGEAPALNDEEIRDVIVFLKTLTDGYLPEQATN